MVAKERLDAVQHAKDGLAKGDDAHIVRERVGLRRAAGRVGDQQRVGAGGTLWRG